MNALTNVLISMLDDGLAEEVTFLKRKGYTRDMVSMQGLGYKEILDYLDGDNLSGRSHLSDQTGYPSLRQTADYLV